VDLDVMPLLYIHVIASCVLPFAFVCAETNEKIRSVKIRDRSFFMRRLG
jgi:hypothetical protein